MTVFENVQNKSKNIDELVDWLYEIGNDYSLWFQWWDSKYCGNCIAEIKYNPEIGRELPHGWCELHQNCRYFLELDEIPDTKQIIKMWLESEVL